MRKFDFGNTIQMVANVGVIAGIVVLAFEIQQNTESIRATASAAYLQRSNESVMPIFADRALAELWEKGNSQFNELDTIDQQRLLYFEALAIRNWAQNFELYQQGLLSDAEWQHTVYEMEFMLPQRQSVQEAWRAFKQPYAVEFQEIVDALLEPD